MDVPSVFRGVIGFAGQIVAEVLNISLIRNGTRAKWK